MLVTRIIWSDTDDDGHVLDPSPRVLRWYHWVWLSALIGCAGWAFWHTGW